MNHIKPVIPRERFHIATHSYAVSFLIKMCLDKTSNIF